MSQAGIISTTAGPVPPTVATIYDTDVNSPAIPAANILDVFGGNYEGDNLLGIQTDGSSGGNILTIQLTNRLTGLALTVGAQTLTPITFPTVPPLPDGTYILKYEIVAHNVTDGDGTSYEIQGCVSVVGGGLILQGNAVRTMVGDNNTFNVNLVDVDVLGTQTVLEVTGVAGKVIHWTAILTYTHAGP